MFRLLMLVSVACCAHFVSAALPATQLPDFAKYQVVQEKKSAFFNFLRPEIKHANDDILTDRDRLRSLSAQSVDAFTVQDKQWLHQLARKYQVELNSNSLVSVIKTLFSRVDVVPVSLVLAQAANESAWGTSRFAVRGNNLFGQWCYEPGCGLVPKQRERGAHHEVQKFARVLDSIVSYMHNLNTHGSYAEFRKLRSTMRKQKKPLNSIVLAQGLCLYSQRKNAYVHEIQSMIRYNKLQRFDK